MTIILSPDEVAAVISVLRERVQKIDYDLGDCNNQETRALARDERALLVRAVGEITVGAA